MADPIGFTRTTRTPIYLGHLEDAYGKYNSAANPNAYRILQSLPLLNSIVRPNKSITIDPDQQGKTNTVGHEQIHALLDSLGGTPNEAADKLDELNRQNPFYHKIAQAILARGMSNPSIEAPAYVRTQGDLQNFAAPERNVPTDYFTQYRNKLVQDLMKMDPNIAQKYQNITGATPIE